MRRSGGGLTLVGLILAVILFVSVNSLSDRFLKGASLDLTDQQLYTLSPGTRAILGKIDEPITLKLYYSVRLGDAVPAYGVYAQRVRELLQEYAALSNGKVRLQIIEPQPYSEEEDQATAAGLQGVPVEEGGEPVYFGLAGTNSTDDSENIPFFQQDREKFLEFDLTKLVQTLAFPKKKVVGLITSLAIDGDPMAQMQGRPSQPQAILDQIRQAYEVRVLPESLESVPDDVDVLMIVQPERLTLPAEYAIDQFVLGGGHVLAFVDPDSEFQKSHRSMMQPQGGGEVKFDRLLNSWGVNLIKDKVVGDQLNALKVNVGGSDHRESADYLAWVNLKADDINAADPITGRLSQINVASAGALEPVKGAKTSFEWLLQSSSDSELIDAAQLKSAPVPDVLGLLHDFKSTGQRYVIAARVTGSADTAFPDGPPKAADADKAKPDAPKPPSKPQLKVAKEPINVVVVADSDILDDRFWVNFQDFMGRRVGTPIANNGDFVQNAVDSLAGSSDLIGLRSRGSAVRPFTRVDAMQREAQDRYQSREKELQTQLQETEAKLQGIKPEEDDSGAVQLTADQQKAVSQFNAQIIQTRTELRQVRLALTQNINRLKGLLALFDIGLVPLLVAIAAVIVGLIRVRRRQRRASAV